MKKLAVILIILGPLLLFQNCASLGSGEGMGAFERPNSFVQSLPGTEYQVVEVRRAGGLIEAYERPIKINFLTDNKVLLGNHCQEEYNRLSWTRQGHLRFHKDLRRPPGCPHQELIEPVIESISLLGEESYRLEPLEFGLILVGERSGDEILLHLIQ